MALVKGTNSYVNLDEADSYFKDRTDVLAWDNADDTLKEKCLTTATLLLDELPWAGQAVKKDQNLAFPRSGSYRDNSRNLYIAFSGTYSFTADTDGEESETDLGRDLRLLRRATYELAYHLANNEGLLDRTGEIESIKVGSISLTDIKNTSVMPSVIRKIIEPMLRNNGSRYWRGW